MKVNTHLPHLIRFGNFGLDTHAGELWAGNEKVHLQEQPLQILMMLLERAGDVVTREEMHRILWPGRSFGDLEDSLNHAVRRLREALGDPAEHPRFIETLPGRGYRFMARVEALTPGPSTLGGRWSAVPFPRIESIAVLPLENLSRDPEQEYFADGMTDALITYLSKISALRLISRTTVMRYKGTKKPLPQIAKELNVDAVVQGTVMRSGNRVRISAQLIQANPERHLWVESYERELGDILSLQAEVTQAIAREIRRTLTPTEQAA
jgi:TolB-like protein